MTPLPRTQQVIESGITQGLHLGAQVYVSVGGIAVAELAIGEARPGQPLTPDHLMLWLSAGKPIAAVAIAQLYERGLLEWDDPVARYMPEFAARGKERVTLRHLLTHTGGFRGVAASWNPAPWGQILARICAAPLEPGWEPGYKAGYHVASSWYVLGEIIQRLSGIGYEQYVRRRIFEPLGMVDSWVGMPGERMEAYGRRIAPQYLTERGLDETYAGNSARAITTARPGAGARGPIRELGRFYEAMMGVVGGVADPALDTAGSATPPTGLFRAATARTLTTRQRVGMYDHTFGHMMDWGLGFMVNSARYGADTVPYGFGPRASDATFGHGGAQSSAGFCDPERKLVVAFVFNGMPGEAAHDRRLRALLAALEEDLGKATER